MNIKEQIRAEIERRLKRENEILWNAKKRGTYPSPSCEYNLLTLTSLRDFLDTVPEQPVSDHHEIEVEFRGEKVTISREFYRDGERNYSTSEQDDNAIWSALRAWCEKKGITPFELYPKQPEQPVEGLEEAAEAHTFFAANQPGQEWETHDVTDAFKAGAEWQKAKMLEGAVEGFVGVHLREKTADVTVNTGYLPKSMGIKGTDKVRVIVIKEDEK